jgi:hypothetical protein
MQHQKSLVKVEKASEHDAGFFKSNLDVHNNILIVHKPLENQSP